MICTDKLSEGIKRSSCPQDTLRGFTGSIIIRDWRGYNRFNPNDNYKDYVEIEAERFLIKPSYDTEVRDDNISLFTHALSFAIKNNSDEAAELLAGYTNIPLTISLRKQDGSYLTLFKDTGAKLNISSEYFDASNGLVMVTCQHFHKEVKESLPPVRENLALGAMQFVIDTTLPGSGSNEFYLPLQDINEVTVDWGDGTSEVFSTNGDKLHTYLSPGIYNITISGSADRVVCFYTSTDVKKLIAVNSMGSKLGWTNASFVFETCSNLKEIRVSNGSWSKDVTTFERFVTGCGSLTLFQTGNWDTSNVTNFDLFAVNCLALTTLDVSNWDTSGVTSFDAFALNCPALKTLDVSNWDTSNVTNFNAFIKDCPALTTLDVSDWDTSSVMKFCNFAVNCLALTTLDVSNWDTSNVTNFNSFADGASSLITLEVHNWNIELVSHMDNFARGVTIPTNIYDQILINWEAQNEPSNISVGFGSSKYTSGGAAETARNSLIANGWTITDGGAA